MCVDLRLSFLLAGSGFYMPTTRHFLGWDGPALGRAGVYLREHFGRGEGGWDLSQVVAVVPAGRAGRRLVEILVTAAQQAGGVLNPPRVVTAGGLPELLYQPGGAVAGDLESALAWVWAMRQMPEDVMVELVANPPGEDDVSGWWSLGKQFRTLRDDLAGHRMGFTDVPGLCEQRAVDLCGERRWEVLDLIDQAYRGALASGNLVDRNTERLSAIREGRCGCDESTQIVLIATPDLNDVATAMLGQVGDRVTALVMAPEQHGDGFDGLGVFKSAYWQDQGVELRPEQVCFVERVSDQPGELLARIAAARDGARAKGETLSADQITVGLGDEKFAEAVMRSLDMAGVVNRHAAGTPAQKSRPAVLLRALGGFMELQRHDALARLLRHADIEVYLQNHTGAGEDARPVIEDWITLLDQYATRHLQGKLTGEWLGQTDRQTKLKALRAGVIALMPVHPAERRPLPNWSVPIAEALGRVYADTFLNDHDTDDRQLGRSLELIAGVLREQSELGEQVQTCPSVTASQAIALTLDRLSDASLPDEGGEPAVEMLGYLELALDDAPVLGICGMNEGLIPTSRNADAFLPDSVRSALSMQDNAHRYGRDLMLLNAITQSRVGVSLISARRSDDGDPLTPSRLLLACDDKTLVQRVRSFFGEADSEAAPLPLPLEHGDVDRFLIPRPVVAPEPLKELHVTAFRQYLACPYRFYLRYVLRLNTLDDRAVEMDPMSFGTLAHAVLQGFGQDEARGFTDPRRVAKYLDERLDALVEKRFGKDPRPAVRIQVEQMRQRFDTFAITQARLIEEGWRIEHVEEELRAEVVVDGEAFTIKGKIDRIDRHDTLGYRVYDYKTGDTAKPPEKTHRTGPKNGKAWVDLQLPLYRDLCGALDITGPIELGYMNLPKSDEGAGPAFAQWDVDDLAGAIETRDGVIRALREQAFWPPNDAPMYPDGLERVCADSVMQRRVVIKASGDGGLLR